MFSGLWNGIIQNCSADEDFAIQEDWFGGGGPYDAFPEHLNLSTGYQYYHPSRPALIHTDQLLTSSSPDATSTPLPPPFTFTPVQAFTTADIRHVAYQIVAPLTITFGIVGNVLNLLALTTRPFIKGGTRIYLTALALSDLSVMLTVIPMMLRWTGHHSRSFYGAVYHAHVELFLNNTFIASSIFIVVCLTVDRYFSVCLPTMFRSIHTKRIARMAVLGSYCLGVLVSVPLTALKDVCRVTNGDQNCDHYDFHENNRITDTAQWAAYLWISECMIRFGPCLILAALNVMIIRRFRLITAKRNMLRAALSKTLAQESAVVESSQSDHQLVDSICADMTLRRAMRNRKYQEEKRLISLLRAIVVLFFVTMTPSAVLSLLYSEGQDESVGFQAFRAAANNLELLNFSLNFCIYFLHSKEFRAALLAIFSGLATCADDELSDNEINDAESDGVRSMFNVKMISIGRSAPTNGTTGGRPCSTSDYPHSEDAHSGYQITPT